MPDNFVADNGEVSQEERFEERLKEGVHIGSIEGELSERQRREVLRGANSAGLDDYLKHSPLTRISFERIADPGQYFFPSRQLLLKVDRQSSSYGEVFVAGETWSVSAAGRTLVDALKRSFVHELGHHLLLTGGYRIRDLATQTYKVASKRGITEYARADADEYFCESLAAYAFHRGDFRRHDPGGFAMIEAAMEALEDGKNRK